MRQTGAVETVEEAGMGTLEIFPLPTDEATLRSLLTEVFTDHWRHVRFGPLIQGAAWEIAVSEAPRKISMLDGYLTVDFETWHFHLCIGEHRGSPGHPVDPQLAHRRRTGRAELYRNVSSGAPTSWAVRLRNGAGEEQITVFLPNPFLSDDMQILPEPDWSRLRLWDHLRQRYLGLEPDPRDREASGFVHG
jgi:hypothetical protein